jgi:hypothetical protein
MKQAEAERGLSFWEASGLEDILSSSLEKRMEMFEAMRDCLTAMNVGQEGLDYMAWAVTHAPELLRHLKELPPEKMKDVFESKPPAPEGYPDTTELDKMQDRIALSQQIGEFVEWLRAEKGVGFFVVHGEEHTDPGRRRGDTFKYHPFCQPINEVLADYFGIDLDLVEEERRNILVWMREKHDRCPIPTFSLTMKDEEGQVIAHEEIGAEVEDQEED